MFQKLTYHTQIFLVSILLMITPTIILGITTANHTVEQVSEEYHDALNTICVQTNITLDTLLSNAEKVSSMYIFNSDVKRILSTDYQENSLELARDDNLLISQIKQANNFNTNIVSCIVQNEHDYIFSYNFVNRKDELAAIKDMKKWSDAARANGNPTYFGSISHSKYTGNIFKNILPMVKVMYDPYANKDLGIMYIGINFDPIEKAMNSSKLKNVQILMFNENNELTYSSEEGALLEENPSLEKDLSDIASHITKNQNHWSGSLKIASTDFSLSGSYNKTTGWKIVHLMDNHVVKNAYISNIQNFIIILFFTIILGFGVSYILSKKITEPMKQLCNDIDSCETGNLHTFQIKKSYFSNRELQQLTDSFNHLNKRLAESLKQNYTVLLNEKQMRLQMLRSQINHHFLYNTLNVISSLAYINHVPEIRTVSNAISSILRYNLRGEAIVKLKDEVYQAEQYIAIQQVRLPHKFTYEINVPEDLKEIKVPAFIFQPLLENCFQHGFSSMEDSCKIELKGELNRGCLVLSVIDNGCGMSSEKLSELRRSLDTQDYEIHNTNNQDGHGIGILNVHKRICAYFGRDYGLQINSSSEGTIISIWLPLS